MGIELRTEEIRQILSGNVAALAHCLILKGVKIEDLDKATLDCFDFIVKRTKELGYNDRITEQNIENEIVMALMLGVVKRQIASVKESARSLGTTVEAIANEEIAEMESLLEENKDHIEKG